MHLSRPRLLRRLDEATRHAVTLITAPAGFGKTELVAAWLRAVRPPVRVRYLRARASAGPSAPSEPNWTALGAERDPPEPLVVFVDDVQHLAEYGDIDPLRWLLSSAGGNLRVVLVGRADPPSPLHQWRLSGQLTVIRSEELLYTLDESTELLTRHGVALPPSAVRKLYDLTDGWPAVTAVAVAAMRGRPDPEAVLDELAADPALGAYLDAEVLGPLASDVRDVVQCLSVAERVSPPLVEALTWRRDGTRFLSAVEQTNVLVSASGSQRWYRYHPLIRRRLYLELSGRSPLRLRDLHRTAAEWYAANCLPADALLHALAGREWHVVTDLVIRHWPELLFDRGPATVSPAVPEAPPEAWTDHLLALAFAVQRRAAGDLDEALAFFRAAENAASTADPTPSPVLDGIRLARVQAERDGAEVDPIAARLVTASRLARPDARLLGGDDAIGAFAWSSLAASRLARGDIDGTEEALRDGLVVARRSGLKLGYVVALAQQALVDLSRGRLAAAAHNAQLALGSAFEAGLDRAPDVSLARVVLAEVHLERGLLGEARHFLERALASGAALNRRMAWWISVGMAQLHHLSGDRAGALAIVERTRAEAGTAAPTNLHAAFIGLLDADLLIADGQAARAAEVLSTLDVPAQLRGWAAATGAKLALAQDRPAAAAAAVLSFVDAGPVSVSVTVEARLLYARALWLLGDRVGGSQQLEGALGLAHPEGLRRPFLANLPMLREMLIAHLTGATAHADTVVELTAAHVGARPTARTVADRLPESLTDRESAILFQLGTMRSTAEIAMALNVSTNTVKTHVRNLYRKLDVGRRRDAVERGRELGLV